MVLNRALPSASVACIYIVTVFRVSVSVIPVPVKNPIVMDNRLSRLAALTVIRTSVPVRRTGVHVIVMTITKTSLYSSLCIC